MVFALLVRLIFCFLGFVWPAYQCFKAIEGKRTDAIKEWSTYWVVLACFTALEPVLDLTLFWLPLYSIAKVLLVLFLWHPRTKGSVYIYDTAVRPLLTRHEADIDRFLAEGQTSAADFINSHFKKVVDLVKANADTITKQLHSLQAKAGRSTTYKVE